MRRWCHDPDMKTNRDAAPDLDRAIATTRLLQAARDAGEAVSAAMVAEARRVMTETFAQVVGS